MGTATKTVLEERRIKKRYGLSYIVSIPKITRLEITIAIALICGFGFSWRLWISSRLFPLAPLNDSFPMIPFPFDYIWFFSLVSALILILIFPEHRMLIFGFVGIAFAMSLWDQTRWQPWFYQYLAMLTAVALGPPRPVDTRRERRTLNICRLIIVSTYFWSGLQKLNANFVAEAWPDMAGSLLRRLPRALSNLPPALTLTIPICEVAIGLGLLTRRFRRVAVTVAVSTHAFILVLLVSSGENTVVWPWNVAMILFVAILFWRDKATTLGEVIVPRTMFHGFALLFFTALPALNFVDLWDSYLSYALYSGNTDQAVIYVSPAVIERLPIELRPHIWQSSKPFFLDVNRWSYGDLNVPLYPEPRVYKAVAKKVCEYAGDSPDIKLRIKGKPDLFTADRQSEYYDCDHL